MNQFEEYKTNYENFEAALDLLIVWHSKAVELARGLYEVPPAAIEEVEAKRIIEVKETATADYVIQTVKGENRTGDLIELRVKNYKNMDKVEGSFLYKDKKQAYVKEEFIGYTFRIEFENYVNPNLSTTIEATPHDITVPPTWGAPITTKVVRKGKEIKGTLTLRDEDPYLIRRIVEEFGPTRWVPIAALDPYMVGAILPEKASTTLLGWRDTLSKGLKGALKVALCCIGTGLLSAASAGGAGPMDAGVGAINLASII